VRRSTIETFFNVRDTLSLTGQEISLFVMLLLCSIHLSCSCLQALFYHFGFGQYGTLPFYVGFIHVYGISVAPIFNQIQ
jgi:hypothetical protein